MSIFGRKAEEIRKQGALERGEFNPTGKPRDMYLYWRATQKNPPKTENFCHFWRVVAIWAPLAYLRAGVVNVLGAVVNGIGAKGFAVLGALGVLATLVALTVFVSPLFLLIPVLLYVLLGIFAAGATLSGYDDLDELRDAAANDDESREILTAFKWSTPVSYAVYGLVRAIKRVSTETWDKVGVVLLVLLSALIVVTLGGLLTNLFLLTGWFGLVWVALAIAGIALFFGALYVFITLVEAAGDRRRRKEKEYLEKIKTGEIEVEVKEKSDWVPGPLLSKILAGINVVWDFFAVAFNYVRVRKWKICPIVKID